MPLILALLWLACTSEPPDGTGEPLVHDSGDTGEAATSLADEGPPFRACGEPIVGLERFTRVASERGLVREDAPPFEMNNPRVAAQSLVVHDLDADGDLDVVAGRLSGPPLVYANDGLGTFTQSVLPGPTPLTYADLIYSQGAADLDGDGLPELLLFSAGQVWLHRNLGDLQFAEREALLPEAGWPKVAHFSGVFGDVDRDGQLDVFLPGLDALGDATAEALSHGSTAARGQGALLRAIGSAPVLEQPWPPEDPPAFSFVGWLYDVNHDDATDVMVASDRAGLDGAPATRLWTASSGGLVSDGASFGLDIELSAMGLATFDWNHDGELDLVMSDIGAPVALQSASGRWVQASAVLGLEVPQDLPGYWIGWSVEAQDLDLDGHIDIAMTAGHVVQQTFAPDKTFPQHNGLWRGLADGGFEEVGASVGFDDAGDQYALVAADLTNDGTLDLIWAGPDGLELFDNACGSERALRIDLRGPPGNREGFGAVVEVVAGEQKWLRQLHGPRALGQGPSEVHVGLGDASLASRVTVRWPDGETSTVTELVAGRRWTIRHPSVAAP